MDNILIQYFHVKGQQTDEEQGIANDDPKEIRLNIMMKQKNSQIYTSKYFNLKKIPSSFLWKVEIDRKIFKGLQSNNFFEFQLEYYMNPTRANKNPNFTLVSIESQEVKFEIDQIEEISILNIAAGLDVQFVKKEKEAIKQDTNDFPENKKINPNKHTDCLINFTEIVLLYNKIKAFKDLIYKFHSSLMFIGESENKISNLENSVKQIETLDSTYLEACELKKKFERKKDSSPEERVFYLLIEYYYSAAFITNKILLDLNILPMCQKILELNNQLKSIFENCNSDSIIKVLLEKTIQKKEIDLRNHLICELLEKYLDSMDALRKYQTFLFEINSSLIYLNCFVNNHKEGFSNDIWFILSNIEKTEKFIDPILQDLDIDISYVLSSDETRKIENPKILNKMIFSLYLSHHNLLTYFGISNETFYIEEKFDLINNIEDIVSHEDQKYANFIRRLISINSEFKAYLANLNENDYMFNFLSLFLNESAKSINNRSCFKFQQHIDFKYARDSFQKTDIFQGFFLYRTKSEKAQVSKLMNILNNRSRELNFFNWKHANLPQNQEINCHLGEYLTLAFTEFRILDSFCCIDVDNFRKIYDEYFPTTTIKSILIHETPHVIGDKANSSSDVKILSPCVLGVHKTDKGENGDLLEHFIMNGEVFHKLFTKGVKLDEELEKLFCDEASWKGNLEKIRRKIIKNVIIQDHGSITNNQNEDPQVNNFLSSPNKTRQLTKGFQQGFNYSSGQEEHYNLFNNKNNDNNYIINNQNLNNHSSLNFKEKPHQNDRQDSRVDANQNINLSSKTNEIKRNEKYCIEKEVEKNAQIYNWFENGKDQIFPSEENPFGKDISKEDKVNSHLDSMRNKTDFFSSAEQIKRSWNQYKPGPNQITKEEDKTIDVSLNIFNPNNNVIDNNSKKDQMLNIKSFFNFKDNSYCDKIMEKNPLLIQADENKIGQPYSANDLFKDGLEEKENSSNIKIENRINTSFAEDIILLEKVGGSNRPKQTCDFLSLKIKNNKQLDNNPCVDRYPEGEFILENNKNVFSVNQRGAIRSSIFRHKEEQEYSENPDQLQEKDKDNNNRYSPEESHAFKNYTITNVEQNQAISIPNQSQNLPIYNTNSGRSIMNAINDINQIENIKDEGNTEELKDLYEDQISQLKKKKVIFEKSNINELQEKNFYSKDDIFEYIIQIYEKFKINLLREFGGITHGYFAAKILIFTGLKLNLGILDEESKGKLLQKIGNFLDLLPGKDKRIKAYLEKNKINQKFNQIVEKVKIQTSYNKLNY